MKITREHYREFIGTLCNDIKELQEELACIEQSEDGCEYEETRELVVRYKKMFAYFMEMEWEEFDDIKFLDGHVKLVEYNYRLATKYSLEREKDELFDQLIAWSTFHEFCKYGMIL